MEMNVMDNSFGDNKRELKGYKAPPPMCHLNRIELFLTLGFEIC